MRVWVKRTKRDCGYAMCKKSAASGCKRIRKGCSSCGKGGQPGGGGKVDGLVCHRGGKVGYRARVSTQYAKM